VCFQETDFRKHLAAARIRRSTSLNGYLSNLSVANWTTFSKIGHCLALSLNISPFTLSGRHQRILLFSGRLRLDRHPSPAFAAFRANRFDRLCDLKARKLK
jgi:hypothetical protein